MPISEYLRNLRAKIGHDLVLMPSASVLPLDQQGRVLLCHQTEFGAWGTIGGAIDPGETPQQAAIREAREEAGIEVKLTGIAAALGGPGYTITYPNGDQCAYISTMFWARVIGGEPTADQDEVDELRWFSREELAANPDLLGPFARTSFAELGWL